MIASGGVGSWWTAGPWLPVKTHAHGGLRAYQLNEIKAEDVPHGIPFLDDGRVCKRREVMRPDEVPGTRLHRAPVQPHHVHPERRPSGEHVVRCRVVHRVVVHLRGCTVSRMEVPGHRQEPPDPDRPRENGIDGNECAAHVREGRVRHKVRCLQSKAQPQDSLIPPLPP